MTSEEYELRYRRNRAHGLDWAGRRKKAPALSVAVEDRNRVRRIIARKKVQKEYMQALEKNLPKAQTTWKPHLWLKPREDDGLEPV